MGERLPSRVFISTYHDTEDLRLAPYGVTLRHRVEDGTGLWQLKLPRGSARLELELPGQASRPPVELVELLPAYLRGRELVPVARLRTRRETIRARGAEIVDDSVSVLEGQRVARRFREIEIELLEGDERDLRRLVKAMRRSGATSSRARCGRSSIARSTSRRRRRLRRSTKRRPPGEALGDRARRRVPGAARPRSRARAAASTRRICTSSGSRPAASGRFSVRPELSSRRSGPSSLREELGWLGGHLGPARDLDVMLDRLRSEVAALGADGEGAAGLLVALEEEREAAYRDVVEVLGERALLRAARASRGGRDASADRRRDDARGDLPPRGEANAPDVRGAR